MTQNDEEPTIEEQEAGAESAEAPQENAELAAVKAELVALRSAMEARSKAEEKPEKPEKPVQVPPMPKDYDAQTIDEIVQAQVQALLQPIADHSRATEAQMIEQVRDNLLAQKKGMSDEHRAKVSREADRQFSTRAASNMEEAINNAMLIVGKETPKQDDGQDARRKSRRGGQGLTPTQQADLEEDASLDEIFLKHNNLN